MIDRIITDLRAAAMLLTRIPVSRVLPDTAPPDTARSYWAFGIIGAAIAAIAMLPAIALLALGTPPLAVAALVAGAIALLTGGLHHDGLADCADGLHGADAGARLKIMHDSRIGSFGVVALIVVVATAIGGMASLAAQSAFAMTAGVIAAAAFSRSMMGVVRYMHAPPPPADDEHDGLAASTGRPDALTVMIGLLLSLAIVLVLCGAAAGLMACLGGAMVSLATGFGMASRIGGVNGDVLGASQQLAEAVMLVILAVLLTG